MTIWRSLRAGAPGRRALEQAGDLHGERRAAGDDVAAGEHELPGGADHRLPVDAVMLGEAPVLVGDQHFEEARIDLAPWSPAGASGRRRW